ncbi:MAG: hypothetical protein PVI94_17070, partial [Desulfobacterales bacterium]
MFTKHVYGLLFTSDGWVKSVIVGLRYLAVVGPVLVNPGLLFFEIIDPRTDCRHTFVVADACYVSFPVFHSTAGITH